MSKSILQGWVTELGLRHQGVLLAAVRGCDTVPRDDTSKTLARFYRACILNPHCEDIRNAASFMQWLDGPAFGSYASNLLKSHDHLPHHYLMHLMHAAEIVGYYHPNPGVAELWQTFYFLFVKKFHLTPETKAQLDERLNADEQTFKENQ